MHFYIERNPFALEKAAFAVLGEEMNLEQRMIALHNKKRRDKISLSIRLRRFFFLALYNFQFLFVCTLQEGALDSEAEDEDPKQKERVHIFSKISHLG